MLARFSATSTSSLLRRSSRAVSVAPRRAFPPLRRGRAPPSPVRARPLVAMASAAARLDKVATPGATAVAVGTANFVDPTTVDRVIDGIEAYLVRKGHSAVKDLVGTVQA